MNQRLSCHFSSHGIALHLLSYMELTDVKPIRLGIKVFFLEIEFQFSLEIIDLLQVLFHKSYKCLIAIDDCLNYS